MAAIYLRLEDKVIAEKLLTRAVAANPEDKISQHMLNALSHTENATDTCPEYAQNLFNNYALFYDNHMRTALHYRLPNQILQVMSELKLGNLGSVLDLGCGTGLCGQVLRDYTSYLEGVDIAHKMIIQAEEKKVYNKLYTSEALAFLEKNKSRYDLIVAADVIPYFGELKKLIQSIGTALKPQGHFIFSTEISTTEAWLLTSSGRFAHHLGYLQELAKVNHFEISVQKEMNARYQAKKPVLVWLLAFQLNSCLLELT